VELTSHFSGWRPARRGHRQDGEPAFRFQTLFAVDARGEAVSGEPGGRYGGLGTLYMWGCHDPASGATSVSVQLRLSDRRTAAALAAMCGPVDLMMVCKMAYLPQVCPDGPQQARVNVYGFTPVPHRWWLAPWRRRTVAGSLAQGQTMWSGVVEPVPPRCRE